MLRKLLVVASTAILMFASYNSEAGQKNKTELYGVMHYADWCGSCKTLDPKIEQAKSSHGLNAKDVLFVKLDFTDEATTNQAKMLVKALGIDEAYATYGDKTGFMLLIDAETKKVVTRLTKKLDANDIAKRINASLDKVSS